MPANTTMPVSQSSAGPRADVVLAAAMDAARSTGGSPSGRPASMMATYHIDTSCARRSANVDAVRRFERGHHLRVRSVSLGVGQSAIVGAVHEAPEHPLLPRRRVARVAEVFERE